MFFYLLFVRCQALYNSSESNHVSCPQLCLQQSLNTGLNSELSVVKSTHHLPEVVSLRHVSHHYLPAPLLSLGDPHLTPGQDVEGVPHCSLPDRMVHFYWSDLLRYCALISWNHDISRPALLSHKDTAEGTLLGQERAGVSSML